MQITGSASVNAPLEQVWTALLDPAVLARTIPGCERLETVGPDQYRGTVQVGVAAIKGAFDGDVELDDKCEPSGLTLRAAGSGSPGTVRADVAVRLADNGAGRTEVTYDATAVIGGMLGGVGQRVLTGVAKRTAGEFFAALDTELSGQAPQLGEPADVTDTVLPQASTPQAALPAAGTSFPGRVPAARSETRPEARSETRSSFVVGVLLGAGVALAGVATGAALNRRQDRSS